ncbi:tautomerase family protein [Vreelandella sp. H-I2]
MPIVTVQQSSGRSKEQSELLVQRITEAFSEAYGTSLRQSQYSCKILTTSIGPNVGSYILSVPDGSA